MVDVCAHEAPVRVGGCANDRFATNVERRVHQHSAAREVLKLFYQIVVVRVGLPSDCLDARCVVKVRYGRNVRPRNVQPVYPPERIRTG